MAAAAKMTHAQLLAAERSKASAAETELAKVREELMQARKAMLEGRGMEAERERLAAEQLEAERQKRVEHLAQVGMRRIMQQGLARGWSAWYDQWEEYTRNKRLLAAAGQRRDGGGQRCLARRRAGLRRFPGPSRCAGHHHRSQRHDAWIRAAAA